MRNINRDRIKNHIKLAKLSNNCIGANHYYRLVIARYWPLRESVSPINSIKDYLLNKNHKLYTRLSK